MAFTENQIHSAVQDAIGRDATPYEVSEFSKVPSQSLASLKDYYSKLNTSQSIVDYLKYTGKDPKNLPDIAKQYGVSNFGTTEGNVALLNMLKSKKPPASVTVPGLVNPQATPPAAAQTPQQIASKQGMNPSEVTLPSGAVLNPDGSVKTPATSESGATPSDQPPRIAGIDTALSAYQTVQQQIADIDTTLRESEQQIRDEVSKSGGIVDSSQLKALVSERNAPLILQRNTLATQQANLGKTYTQMLSAQKESDANFFKSKAEADKQTALEQSQQKIDAAAAQNEIKNTQADEKIAQAGFKLTKVNVTDAAGNVLGQQLLWSKNPAAVVSDNKAATVKTSAGSGGITKAGVTNVGNTADHPKLTLADGASPEQVLQSLISGKSIPVKGSTTPLSQQTLYNLAIADMLGSTSSAGGRTPSGAILAVKDKETEIMNAYGLTPFDIASAKQEFQGMSAANTALLATAAFTKTYAATASDNLQLGLDQSAKVPRGGAKIKNQYDQWLAGNFTPAGDLAEFETYIYTAAREYAKVTSGGAKSSAGLTDSASAEASKLINAAQSPEVFKKVVTAMQNDMNNVINNFDKQTTSYPASVKKLYGMAAGPSSDIASQVKSAGYDYPSMHNAGYSDEDIKKALNIK